MNALFPKEKPPTAGVRRILALWFPHLATERIRRRRLGRSWRSGGRPEGPPLVVSRREQNAQRIASGDEQAGALRLKRGMGIADARAMHPCIEIVEEDPEADRKLLEALADWCDRYTPLVAIDGVDGLFLDITGCAHLFGGEKTMLADLLRRLFEQGFAAQGGLASTPGAAWAAARFLSPALVGPALIEQGEEAALLAPLPLAALRLDPAVCAGLEGVGLRMVGSILSTPRAPLARRFGKGVLLRLDQALGHVEESISPRFPIPPLSVERALVEPITATEDVEQILAGLARTLRPELERRGEGARRLRLSLFRVDGVVHRIQAGASRPVRDPALLMRLFRERLAALEGRIDAGFGFELVRLCVLETAAFADQQASLAGSAAGEAADVADFADRLFARLGPEALMVPVMRESHLPERRVAMVPFVQAPSFPAAAKGGDSVQRRPARLFRQPEPVEVTAAEVPEGPPLNFRWRRGLYRVARSEGPERIAPEWWRQEPDAPTRDYFRVEDEAGRRFWLYRQGLYGTAHEMPRWFVHGVFA